MFHVRYSIFGNWNSNNAISSFQKIPNMDIFSFITDLGAGWAPAYVEDLEEMILIQEKEKTLSDVRTFWVRQLGYENLEALGYGTGKNENKINHMTKEKVRRIELVLLIY